MCCIHQQLLNSQHTGVSQVRVRISRDFSSPQNHWQVNS